jgi:translation initiation factor IF-3
MRNKKTQLHKINTDIKSIEVRLVGEEEPRVLKTSEALSMAMNSGKDLIVISDQKIPIVKIEDYNKFLYDKQKAEKERKKNSSKSVIKEIQLSPEIGDNDLNVKARKALEFLEKGNKVKCSLMLKGRQRANPERGEVTMLRFAEILSESGTLESMPKLQGNRWNMMVKPKKS